ncbi:MAG: pilus assembly protein [Chloroflexota bacterium]|nr:pilus assembly protein [Chloroflexota bacterium]
MVTLKRQLKKVFLYLFVPPEEGQGLVEYALLLFLIAVVVVSILATIGPAIYSVMTKVVDYGLS